MTEQTIEVTCNHGVIRCAQCAHENLLRSVGMSDDSPPEPYVTLTLSKTEFNIGISICFSVSSAVLFLGLIDIRFDWGYSPEEKTRWFMFENEWKRAG